MIADGSLSLFAGACVSVLFKLSMLVLVVACWIDLFSIYFLVNISKYDDDCECCFLSIQRFCLCGLIMLCERLLLIGTDRTSFVDAAERHIFVDLFWLLT